MIHKKQKKQTKGRYAHTVYTSLTGAMAVGWVVVSLCLLLSLRYGWLGGGLSLSPSIVKVRVAGWWSLSVSFYR